MRYVKEFQTQIEYNDYRKSLDYSEPHLVLIKENNEIHYQQKTKYLTIEALEDGLTAKLSVNNCQYSLDGKTWVNLPANTETPAINNGERIYFKATGLTPLSNQGIGTFTVNKLFNLRGNCMSMLFGDNANGIYDLTGYDYAFTLLFTDNTNLLVISKDFLPATILSDWCYDSMFRGCTSLIAAPNLNAETLKTGCYYDMFNGCENLTYIKALFNKTSSDNDTKRWVRNVNNKGVFVKNKNTFLNTYNENNIPLNWILSIDNENILWDNDYIWNNNNIYK